MFILLISNKSLFFFVKLFLKSNFLIKLDFKNNLTFKLKCKFFNIF